MIARMRHAASPLSLHRHLPERSSPSRSAPPRKNRAPWTAPGRPENFP